MAVELTLRTQDGYALGATLFEPDAQPQRAVLIMAATGVPQGYYARFATFLAERGSAVLTFDYRGIGRSRHAPVKKLQAGMRDWALLDAAAALAHLEGRAAGLMVVGHSFGGQVIGLLPQPERIAAALTVGAPSGYWLNYPLLARAWLWPAMQVLLPAVVRTLGYLPAARLGFGEDLPAGVALEWARWCRHPEYVVGALQAHAAFARYRAPLRAYAISDDAFAPPQAVRALLELYRGSKPELRALTPAELGAKGIGHFGFFREPFRDTLWREAADWLEAY